MTDPGTARGLTDDDVDQVTRLVESLDRSGFDFLQVELGDLRITIGTGEPPSAGAPPAPPAPPVPTPAAALVAAPAVPAAPAVVPQPEVVPPPVAATVGSLEIVTPTMGIFYSRPEPGKPPFVAVGDIVEESTTVALVEVMKTFHAVAAGVRGTVAEILVADNQLVEHGDVLMRVAPGDAS